jgi:hypothetical protein
VFKFCIHQSPSNAQEKVGSDMQSNRLVDTMIWSGRTDVTTVVARSSGNEFAMYNSLVNSHVPILISSNVSLQVLGVDYSMWRPPELSWATIARGACRIFGVPNYSVVTLKSNAVSSQENEDAKFGELLVVIRSALDPKDVPQLQAQLNSCAQELHDLYENEEYGRLVLSFCRIISKTN